MLIPLYPALGQQRLSIWGIHAYLVKLGGPHLVVK
jgi:hypothetical protein